jgi:hypothetical protein
VVIVSALCRFALDNACIDPGRDSNKGNSQTEPVELKRRVFAVDPVGVRNILIRRRNMIVGSWEKEKSGAESDKMKEGAGKHVNLTSVLIISDQKERLLPNRRVSQSFIDILDQKLPVSHISSQNPRHVVRMFVTLVPRQEVEPARLLRNNN